MEILIARWMLGMIGTYLALGLAFSIPFVTVGIGRVDPAARGASWGFRLIVLPGVVGLWPLLVRRWLSGRSHPPEERTAHRLAARRGAR